MIYQYLSREAYWCKGVPQATVQKAIDNSLCFGLYCHEQQIGFARMITDHATFAYLSDVFVLPAHRGHGLSKWLMQCIFTHPELQDLRRIMLATADAHGLYSQFGFEALDHPERFMQIVNADVYQSEESVN